LADWFLPPAALRAAADPLQHVGFHGFPEVPDENIIDILSFFILLLKRSHTVSGLITVRLV